MTVKKKAGRYKKAKKYPIGLTAEQKREYDLADTKGKRELTNRRKAELAARLPKVPPLKQKKLLARGFEPDVIEEVHRHKNLASLAQEDQLRVLTILRRNKIDPFEELVKELDNPDIRASDRLAILKFLIPYTTSRRPELKAIDVQQETKMNVSVNITSYRGVGTDMIGEEVVQSEAKSLYDEFIDNAPDDIDSMVANDRRI